MMVMTLLYLLLKYLDNNLANAQTVQIRVKKTKKNTLVMSTHLLKSQSSKLL